MLWAEIMPHIETTERVRRAADIFDKYEDQIRTMISLNVKEQSAADDMFQELFLSVVQNPVPPGARVDSYLYRVVTHDLIDENRKLTHYSEFVRDYRQSGLCSPSQEAPEEGVIRLEEAQKMLASLRKRLPSHEAEAVIQRYVCGKKTRDAAKQMNLDARTFSKYLTRGKAKIRQLLANKRDRQGDKNGYIQQSVEL